MLPDISCWARIRGAGYHAYMVAGDQPEQGTADLLFATEDIASEFLLDEAEASGRGESVGHGLTLGHSSGPVN